MEIRGERECQSCGTRWSYYETGAINCPECGSIRSIGVDERKEHTDGPATLDLSAARNAIDEEPLGEVAQRAADTASEYVRTAGFVHAGEIQPFSETYLVAAELRRAGSTLARKLRVDEESELYFLSLLRSELSGERPPPEKVPDPLRADRGLAVAASATAYAADLRRVLDEPEAAVASVLSAVRARRKRIEALDGDVDPAEAEQIVLALRDLGRYLREDDETALARAQERLD
ncbi:MAG: putative nucleic acid-binding Zn-ribbon protein [Haloarculaceae archaeon]|jgi:predicted  nucleic acid-binding Zn-ribbon protein